MEGQPNDPARTPNAGGPVSDPPPVTRQQAASSLRWNSVGTTGREGMRVLFSLILAAWLGPKNFGIVGQAAVYTALTSLFIDQGFSAALIRLKRITRAHEASVFVITVVAAGSVAVMTYLLAPAVAAFFRTPELTAILRVLAVGTLMKGFMVVPHALLVREMRFRFLATAELSGTLASGAAGLAAALLGAEYWSLVIMLMAYDVWTLVAYLGGAGRPAFRWTREAFRDVFSFSLNMMGAQLVNYASRNLDNVIIGRVLGPSALAFYSLSYRVMMLPIQNLARVVTRVTLPMYARLQDDRARLAREYVLGTQMLAVASFPPMIALIVIAPVAIPTLLGPEWEPAVVPMQILAFTGMRQTASTLGSTIIAACGRADWQFRFSLFSAAVVVASFFIGVNWGVVGVAAAYTIVSAFLMPILAVMVGKLIPVSFGAWLRALLPAASSGLVAAAAGTLALEGVQNAGLGNYAAIVAGGAGVMGGFALTLRLAWSGDWASAREMVELLLLRRREQPSPA